MGLPLVVLAAGLSTRYGQLKQLDPLGPDGEAIMDYNMFDAARAGFDRMIIVTRTEIHDAVAEHVAAVVGDALPIEYSDQVLDRLPDGFRAPPDRNRPWGTGHAVLCASEHTSGPFAVCNADDLYGPGAFALLYAHMTQDPLPTEAALAGYTLEDTLSGSGGVARGICVMGTDGMLSRVEEVRDVRQNDGWITGQTVDAQALELAAGSIVSMNLWGFTQPVVDHMHRQFTRFLGMHGADTSREFLLSTAVNGQVQVGSTAVAVLHASDRWFGVTHPADRARAEAVLLERLEAGAYPRPLAEGFAALAV